MVLKLASDEVQEVQSALSVAYQQVLREAGRVDGYVDRKAGLEAARGSGGWRPCFADSSTSKLLPF